MHPVDNRMAYWVDVLADTLQKPLTSFPRVAIMAAFEESYEVTGVSWRRSDPRGFSIEMTDRLARNFGKGVLAEPAAFKLISDHGLVRWFAITRDPAAQTLARVPTSISSRRHQASVREILATARGERLMAVPYRWEWPHYSAFMLAREGSDFTPQDLQVARRVQRVLWAIEAQVRILGDHQQSAALEENAAAADLSGRELAVLNLLARGLTAQAIGRRLGASPRTIQKHLQHIYHKLGVNDRMAAVRIATARQLLVGSVGVRSPAAPRPECDHVFPAPEMSDQNPRER